MLTDDELSEAARTYNEDRTLLIIPFSSGRTGIFTRRMDLIAVEDHTVLCTPEAVEFYINVRAEQVRAKPRWRPPARPSLDDLGL